MQPQVTALYYYPVKSCGGIALKQGTIGPRGFVEDRAWMIVDRKGKFLTQREHPRLSLIRPEPLDGCLILKAPGAPDLRVPVARENSSRKVTIWRDTCAAVDQGDEAAEWLREHLGVKCRLVRMHTEHTRGVDPRYARTNRDQVSFQDGYPFLLASQSSLDDLNSRMEMQLPMNRFRPNIVVSGFEPFAEDSWETVRIGEVTFDVVKPCSRCVTTTVDQQTARKGREPLVTLSKYRRVEKKVLFAQNLIHRTTGIVRVGDAVEVLSYKQAAILTT